MLLNQIHNEDKEDNKNENSNKNSIFKKVELEINLNKTPKRTIEQKDKKLDLPYIHLSREIVNHKIDHIQNFCNSLYSNYNDYSRNRNINDTILNMCNSKEQMNDILIDSKLKAIEDIKHYFYINKFPNEVNFRKKNKKDLYKRKYSTREHIKPISLKKINNIINRNNQEDEKFTLITTLNAKKENEEKKDINKIYHSIDSHTNRKKNKKFNFEDYAMNNIKIKHPILYKLNSKNKKNLPSIHRKNKIFNDIVEISNLIPDKTEINNETKINNYSEYMRLKELKIIK
jgi:hypothetical protein